MKNYQEKWNIKKKVWLIPPKRKNCQDEGKMRGERKQEIAYLNINISLLKISNIRPNIQSWRLR